jgi:hypothetical protein
MYFLLEARTRRGTRLFIVAGDTVADAAIDLWTRLKNGERIMDDCGDWLEASEINADTIVASGIPSPPAMAVSGQFTNDGQRMV